MKRFLSLVMIGTLVISMVGAFPAVAEEEYDQLVLIRDVGETEDISALKEVGDVLDRYGRYVLLETSDSEIEGLEYNYDIDRLENRNQLNIKGHEFDTNEEYPDFDPELMIDEYDPGTEGLYIVDMIGPVNPEWRQELEELGVEVINYQPNYAYEVSMTPEKADKVEELFFVDWVGVYQPAFKLGENLTNEEVINIRLVESYSEKNLNKLRNYLDIHSVTELPTGGIRIRADVRNDQKIYRIAQMSQVYYMSNSGEPRLDDGMGTQITGGGTYFWPPDWEEDEGAFRLEEKSDVGDPVEPYGGEAGSLANQLGYTGNDVTIAVADSGIGDGSEGDAGHPDFTGRVKGGYSYVWGEDDWIDARPHSHGTTVSGLAAADTYQGNSKYAYENYYKAQGAAPEAELFAVRIFDEDGIYRGPSNNYYEIVEKAREEGDAYIHTNSWGDLQDLGEYIDIDEDFDRATRDAGDGEPIVITASVGNVGEDGTNSPGTGKNIISVGASENFNPEAGTENPDKVWTSSAHGGTDDNRVKPDVVAPGIERISTATPYYDDFYPYRPSLTGTSYSTPTVAGQAAVIVEWYEDTYYEKPSPAMVKALLINTAESLESDQSGDGNIDSIPNNHEGWGLVNLVDLVHEEGPEFILEDQENNLETGEEAEYALSYEDSDEPMKISLVWTDKEAKEGDEIALKNNLDLEVESPNGDVYRGNAFAEDGGESTWDYTYPNTDTMSVFDDSGDGWDDTNNVQNVYIHPDELESGSYKINVIGENIPEENQDYALVMQNAEIPDEEKYTLSVDSSGDGHTDPEEGTYSYTEGTDVGLSAWPSLDWEFSHWDINDNTYYNSHITITMDEDKDATAYFVPEGFDSYETTLDSNYNQYLEEGPITEELAGAFRDEDLSLPDAKEEVTLIEKADGVWNVLVDEEERFLIVEREKELEVYSYNT